MIIIKLRAGYDATILRTLKAQLVSKGFVEKKIRSRDQIAIFCCSEFTPPLSGVFDKLEIGHFAACGITVEEKEKIATNPRIVAPR